MADRTDRTWEFDSLLETRGRILQVWSRPSAQWDDTREWTLMPNTPGRENPPYRGIGHYTNTEAFRRAYPEFRPPAHAT